MWTFHKSGKCKKSKPSNCWNSSMLFPSSPFLGKRWYMIIVIQWIRSIFHWCLMYWSHRSIWVICLIRCFVRLVRCEFYVILSKYMLINHIPLLAIQLQQHHHDVSRKYVYEGWTIPKVDFVQVGECSSLAILIMFHRFPQQICLDPEPAKLILSH